jgi:hypothetical protein
VTFVSVDDEHECDLTMQRSLTPLSARPTPMARTTFTLRRSTSLGKRECIFLLCFGDFKIATQNMRYEARADLCRQFGGVEPYWGLFDADRNLKNVTIPVCS